MGSIVRCGVGIKDTETAAPAEKIDAVSPHRPWDLIGLPIAVRIRIFEGREQCFKGLQIHRLGQVQILHHLRCPIFVDIRDAVRGIGSGINGGQRIDITVRSRDCRFPIRMLFQISGKIRHNLGRNVVLQFDKGSRGSIAGNFLVRHKAAKDKGVGKIPCREHGGFFGRPRAEQSFLPFHMHIGFFFTFQPEFAFGIGRRAVHYDCADIELRRLA